MSEPSIADDCSEVPEWKDKSPFPDGWSGFTPPTRDIQLRHIVRDPPIKLTQKSTQEQQ